MTQPAPPKASPRATRRAFLGRWPLTLLGVVAAILPGTRPASARRRDDDYDPQRQIWLCTYNECDPYYYVPAKGDPENIMGTHPIPPGTTFEDLPDDWRCPVCGAGKIWFVKDRMA